MVLIQRNLVEASVNPFAVEIWINQWVEVLVIPRDLLSEVGEY